MQGDLENVILPAEYSWLVDWSILDEPGGVDLVWAGS